MKLIMAYLLSVMLIAHYGIMIGYFLEKGRQAAIVEVQK